MKCICVRKCQVSIGGRASLVSAGKVLEFDECPSHFEPVDNGEEIDFLIASEDELKARKWKFADAAEAIKKYLYVDLDHEEGMTKSKAIDMIMDARFRAIDNPSKVS